MELEKLNKFEKLNQTEQIVVTGGQKSKKKKKHNSVKNDVYSSKESDTIKNDKF